MTQIISKERYQGQIKCAMEKHIELLRHNKNDDKFRKVGSRITELKGLYGRSKVYAVKQMNYFKRSQLIFINKKRVLMIFVTEVLQKLVFHNKLQKHKNNPKARHDTR